MHMLYSCPACNNAIFFSTLVHIVNSDQVNEDKLRLFKQRQVLNLLSAMCV